MQEEKKNQGESAICSIGHAGFKGPLEESNEFVKQNLYILPQSDTSGEAGE